MLLPVATANKPPNPTAGARQAKNRNITAARHYIEIAVRKKKLTDIKMQHIGYVFDHTNTKTARAKDSIQNSTA